MRAWLRIPLQLATLGVLTALGLVAVVTGAYYYAEPGLPSATELRVASSSLQIPLNIYSRDGRLMQQYGEQLRTPADFDEIPLILRQGIIAAEDDQFYQHSGIDLLSTLRAVLNYTVS
ncbi:MAG TPA: transglycosylase domain-containing protein, partial [Gammaproteobacteria bacterium]|nr:transglycosylase domain-containing protein [Gammaproteobacteria bacterium]